MSIDDSLNLPCDISNIPPPNNIALALAILFTAASPLSISSLVFLLQAFDLARSFPPIFT